MNKVVFLRANPVDPDPRIEKQARTLAKAGWQVSILGWDRSKSLPRKSVKDHYTIYRTGPKSVFGTGFRNLGGLLLWQVDLLKWLWARRDTYSYIHAADLDTVLPALMLKMFCGKRVVYDIFDFFADSRKGPEFLKTLARLVELRVIGLVDAVILVDESRKLQIQGAKPKRLEFVYNSPEEVIEAQLDEEKPKYGLHIVFVGFLQDQRWLFEMVDLVAEHPDWHFDLAGFGDLAESLEAIVSNIPNIKFHGRISHDKAMQLSQSADVLFAIYDPEFPNHKFSSANKLFEAMMLGKPILVARGTGMDRLVEQYNLGFVVDYKSKVQIEQALGQIHSWSGHEKSVFAQRVRGVYDSHFSWAIMSQRVLDLYSTLG